MADPTPFLQKLFAALEALGIDVSTLELDHLCYRVETPERYSLMRQAMALTGELLAESIIGARHIATYRLHVPFSFEQRSIGVVELAAPKPGSPYPEGFEHAEFVVQEDLRSFTQKHPHLKWELSGLKKTEHPEVRLRFPGFSAKFHGQPLAEVIAQEQRR